MQRRNPYPRESVLAITKRPKVRDVTFRKVENLYQAAKQITSSRVLSALAVHRRGETMLNECSNCREGKGNFTECVSMKGYLTDCCTSCYLVYKTMADQKTRADKRKHIVTSNWVSKVRKFGRDQNFNMSQRTGSCSEQFRAVLVNDYGQFPSSLPWSLRFLSTFLPSCLAS